MHTGRKVTFKKFIPVQWDERKLGEYRTKVPGTQCWTDFIYFGYFHEWASRCEESEQGYGNSTVALVEMSDGTIEEVMPSALKFIDQL